jgi:hypothetical protein
MEQVAQDRRSTACHSETGGKSTELSPSESIYRTVVMLSESGRLEHILKVVDSAPR